MRHEQPKKVTNAAHSEKVRDLWSKPSTNSLVRMCVHKVQSVSFLHKFLPQNSNDLRENSSAITTSRLQKFFHLTINGQFFERILEVIFCLDNVDINSYILKLVE